jgi:hypothetical protein
MGTGGAMSPELAERFELLKKGLNNLMASGAATPEEAADLVARISRVARSGSKLEVETMKIWPDDPKTAPTAKFFVNDRIDLLIREAETFRNDYRTKEYRNIFLALKKPLPFAGPKPAKPAQGEAEPLVDTTRFCGYLLGTVVICCWMITSLALFFQSRRTR